MARYLWTCVGDGIHKVMLEHDNLSLPVCVTSGDDNARHIAWCLEATAQHQVAGLDAISLSLEIGHEIGRLFHESIMSVPEATMRDWLRKAQAIESKIQRREPNAP